MPSDENAISQPMVGAMAPGGMVPLAAAEERLAGLDEVPLQVEVRLGRALLTLGELLRLRPGAVVAPDRLVHEPAEVMVGGKVIARGQIVVVGNELGVRVTELALEQESRP